MPATSRPLAESRYLKPLLRRIWRLPLVTSWVLLGLLLAGLLPLWPQARRHALCEGMTLFWMRGLLRLLPLRIQRHGQPIGHPAVWVGNHISWLDIVLLGAVSPVRFIAKAEVRQWPLLGWLAASAGTLFVRRGQASGGDLYQQMTAALQQQQSLMIFAEGTTTPGDRVRTFHGRLLSCAVEQQVPVQPVALRYCEQGQLSRTAAFIDDDELSSHLWQLLGGPTIDVELHFLPAIDSCNIERNPLARRTRQAVVQALGLDDSKPGQSTEALSTAA